MNFFKVKKYMSFNMHTENLILNSQNSLVLRKPKTEIFFNYPNG